jgi:hypothetical protein
MTNQPRKTGAAPHRGHCNRSARPSIDANLGVGVVGFVAIGGQVSTRQLASDYPQLTAAQIAREVEVLQGTPVAEAA